MEIIHNELLKEILKITIASIVSWINFVLIDTYFGLPEKPGVLGAKVLERKLGISVET